MYRSVAAEALPAPVLFPARQVQGVVESPGEPNNSKNDAEAMPPPPPSLERSGSLSGNILTVDSPQGERAYWLQRKMCKTTHGSVRLGFRVTRRDGDSSTTCWTVQPSTNGSYPFEMVAIKIQDKVVCEHTPRGTRDPQVEFSALQMVAGYDPEGLGHVVTGIVCTDNENVFVIMPYYGEGSLVEYIAENGRLSEEVARHFFQQIISVRTCL
jgi:hypothetical protein